MESSRFADKDFTSENGSGYIDSGEVIKALEDELKAFGRIMKKYWSKSSNYLYENLLGIRDRWNEDIRNSKTVEEFAHKISLDFTWKLDELTEDILMGSLDEAKEQYDTKINQIKNYYFRGYENPEAKFRGMVLDEWELTDEDIEEIRFRCEEIIEGTKMSIKDYALKTMQQRFRSEKNKLKECIVYAQNKVAECMDAIFNQVYKGIIEYYIVEIDDNLQKLLADIKAEMKEDETLAYLQEDYDDDFDIDFDDYDEIYGKTDEEMQTYNIREGQSGTGKNSKIFSELTKPYDEFISGVENILAYLDEGVEDIQKDILALKSRLKDEYLYLGTIGSFSSGKSTFINSMIHKNLLPTDAVQGTTVSTCILKKSDKNDLEIVYSDGTKKVYSECGTELLRKYLDESYTDFKTYDAVRLFEKIISTENMAMDIEYITLYYENKNLLHNIALVDTPGIDSLNKRHDSVTENAINNICDAIAVIIPYDIPVSESLLNYINDNLEAQKRDLIFLVTKVELLSAYDELDELPSLLRTIRKRLEKGLKIESPCIIPMPTFTYLKEVDAEMTTKIPVLENMSDGEREELIKMYGDGMKTINEILEKNRSKYIKNRTTGICRDITDRLNKIVSEMIKKDKEHREKYAKEVQPVNRFKEWVQREIRDFNKSIKKQIDRESEYIDREVSIVKDAVCRAIDSVKSIDDEFPEISYHPESFRDEMTERANILMIDIQETYSSIIDKINYAFYSDWYNCCDIAPMENYTDLYSWEFDLDFPDELEAEIEKIRKTCEESVNRAIESKAKGVKAIGFLVSYTLNKFKLLKKTFNEMKPIIMNGIDEMFNLLKKHFISTLNTQIDENIQAVKYDVFDAIEENRKPIEDYIKERNRLFNNKDTKLIVIRHFLCIYSPKFQSN